MQYQFWPHHLYQSSTTPNMEPWIYFCLAGLVFHRGLASGPSTNLLDTFLLTQGLPDISEEIWGWHSKLPMISPNTHSHRTPTHIATLPITNKTRCVHNYIATYWKKLSLNLDNEFIIVGVDMTSVMVYGISHPLWKLHNHHLISI